MIFHAILAAAAATPKPADPVQGWFSIFSSPLPLIIAAFLFVTLFMGKGKKDDEKKRQEMLKLLKRGDKIQTIGGIQGSVVKVDEQLARVEVKVDESSNVKVWFARTAIARVLDAEKAEK